MTPVGVFFCWQGGAERDFVNSTILSRGCLGFSAGAALSALAGRPRLGFSSVCSLTGFFSGAVFSFAGALFFAALKSSTFGAGAAFSSGWPSTE